MRWMASGSLLKKSEIAQLEKSGLVPMVFEYGSRNGFFSQNTLSMAITWVYKPIR